MGHLSPKRVTGEGRIQETALACEPQLLSPRATATEAHVPRARALQQEKPLQ